MGWSGWEEFTNLSGSEQNGAWLSAIRVRTPKDEALVYSVPRKTLCPLAATWRDGRLTPAASPKDATIRPVMFSDNNFNNETTQTGKHYPWRADHRIGSRSFW